MKKKTLSQYAMKPLSSAVRAKLIDMLYAYPQPYQEWYLQHAQVAHNLRRGKRFEPLSLLWQYSYPYTLDNPVVNNLCNTVSDAYFQRPLSPTHWLYTHVDMRQHTGALLSICALMDQEGL